MKQSTKYFILSVTFLFVAVCLLSYNNLFLAVPFALISIIGIIAYNKEESAKESK